MKRTFWLVLVCGLLAGALGGCTPKPTPEQLQNLSGACAEADDAERAVESAQRRQNAAESRLAQKRRTLQERQGYLGQVRMNLEAAQGTE